MGATQDNKNWHSASEDCGFGTPSYENSQHVEDHEPGKNKIKIVPEVFSPNNDGYHDVVQLYYEFDQPGYVANITIFDARGRIVRKLVNNELLGMEGSFTWNGLNDSNSIPVMGIYLFFIEIYDLKGNVSHYKRTCVLAKKIKP
jgi:gliding motility-associated-like protein